MDMITREHKRLDNYRMDMADGFTALGVLVFAFLFFYIRD